MVKGRKVIIVVVYRLASYASTVQLWIPVI